MAKAEKNPDTFEKSNDAQDALTLENSKAIAAESINDFSQVDASKLQGLTQEYLQLKENNTYNFCFTQRTTFKGDKGGEVAAVVLVDEKGLSFINGNTVLVNSLSKVKQMPCFVRIITGKLIKSASGAGKYLDMEIFALPKVMEG
jgi:hypothetical protein